MKIAFCEMFAILYGKFAPDEEDVVVLPTLNESGANMPRSMEHRLGE